MYVKRYIILCSKIIFNFSIFISKFFYISFFHDIMNIKLTVFRYNIKEILFDTLLFL